MIKRALGLWADTAPGEEDDDSDQEISPEERRKLERRMLPGALKPAKRKQTPVPPPHREAKVVKDSDDESGSDESGSEEARGGWASEDPSVDEEDEEEESDDEMAMPAERRDKDKAAFRGAFHCQLCPDKILLNEKLLEAHLQSAAHKKAERRLERAKVLGVEAFEAECMARKKARELKASGVKSKRQLKSEAHWQKKRKKSKKNGKEAENAEITKEEIDERKRRFQAKKARRQELRQASEPSAVKAANAVVPSHSKKKVEPVSDSAAQPASSRPNRKQRRAALQAAHAAKQGATQDQAPAAERPQKKKKKAGV